MNKKQSLFHIAKRDTLPLVSRPGLIRGGAIVLALMVCALVTTLLTGENPLKRLRHAFSTARSAPPAQDLGHAPGTCAILLGISLAVTPAFKMRFWNIGAEGQVLIGGLATAACMIYLGRQAPQRRC